MDTNDEQQDRDWIGPELPSLGSFLVGTVLFTTGGMLMLTVIGTPVGIVRRGARHVAHTEGATAMITRTTTGTAAMLERCEMPAEEIDWLLTANDLSVVHMLLELHAERLREELAERLAALRDIEMSLTAAA